MTQVDQLISEGGHESVERHDAHPSGRKRVRLSPCVVQARLRNRSADRCHRCRDRCGDPGNSHDNVMTGVDVEHVQRASVAVREQGLVHEAHARRDSRCSDGPA